MGRKERREREQKRQNYASKHSAEKRKNTLIAIGVLGVIAAIVGYAVFVFVTTEPDTPEGLEGAGVLGSAHTHAAILVKIHGDEFDFSAPAYQIKSPWIHFEGRDGSTIHKHAEGVTLGYLFETLSLEIDEECFVFQNGREFCSSEEFDLLYYINDEQVPDIREHESEEGDRILISYGATQEELEAQLFQLRNQELIK